MRDDIIYGIHVVLSILKRAPQRILEIHLLDTRTDARLSEVLNLAKEQGLSVHIASKKQLDTWTKEALHQGVVAMVRPVESLSLHDLLQLIENSDTAPLLLILDGVQDPHNLGACLRTADAAGVMAVIIPKDRSSGLTPLVHKVASGAALTMPVIEVTNLVRAMEDLKKENIWLMGTTASTGTTSTTADHKQQHEQKQQRQQKQPEKQTLKQPVQSLYKTDLRGRIAIVLGAEGTGLRRLTEETCDILMQIPMLGTVESLNVSVAAGVCLFEAVRQRNTV